MHEVTSSAQTRIHRHAGWMATSARELFNAAAFEASLYLSWLLSRRATRSLHAPLKQPAICTKQLASSITRPSRQGICQPASIRHPGKDCHGTILSSQDRLSTGDLVSPSHHSLEHHLLEPCADGFHEISTESQHSIAQDRKGGWTPQAKFEPVPGELPVSAFPLHN